MIYREIVQSTPLSYFRRNEYHIHTLIVYTIFEQYEQYLRAFFATFFEKKLKRIL